jgi:hypothetical protein
VKYEGFDWDSWLFETMDEHMEFLAQRFELAIEHQRELSAGRWIELSNLRVRHWALEQQLHTIQESSAQPHPPAADPDSG